jgi:hypothetical protein
MMGMGKRCLDPPVAKTAMGKLLFKASDAGRFDILWGGEDSTQCELRQGSGTKVFLVLKVRPEAFPNSMSMSVF